MELDKFTFARHDVRIQYTNVFKNVRNEERPTVEDQIIVQAVLEIMYTVKSYGGLSIALKSDDDNGKYVSLFYDDAYVVILRIVEDDVFIYYIRNVQENWKQELYALARAHAKMNPV